MAFGENQIYPTSPHLSPQSTTNSLFKGLIEVEEEVETESGSEYESDEPLNPQKSNASDENEDCKKAVDNRKYVVLGPKVDYPEDKVGSQSLLPQEFQLRYHKQQENRRIKLKKKLRDCNKRIPLSVKLLCSLSLAGIIIGAIVILIITTATTTIEHAKYDLDMMANYGTLDKLHTAIVAEHIHSQTFLLTDGSLGSPLLSDARKIVNEQLDAIRPHLSEGPMAEAITTGKEKNIITHLSKDGISASTLVSVRSQVDSDSISSYTLSTFYNQICYELQYLYSGVSSNAKAGATTASLLSTGTASALGPILANVYTSALNISTGAVSSPNTLKVAQQVIVVGTSFLEPLLRSINPDFVDQLLAFQTLKTDTPSTVIDFFNNLLASFGDFSVNFKSSLQSGRQQSQQLDIVFLILAAVCIAVSLLLAIGLVICCAVVIKRSYRKEEKQTLSIMSKFVPKGYLRLTGVDHIRNAKLGSATRKTLSIMFVDIRSFTSLSENMSAVTTFDFLNDYLSHVGPVIRQYGGYTDKYIGDGIMALFPDAWCSIQAALHMQDSVRRMNKNNKLRRSRFPSNIRIGIGIHTGDCIIGAVGYKQRIDGTIIGDTVNLASRIEGLTKRFGAQILISETCAATGLVFQSDTTLHKKSYCKRYIGKIAPKGKKIGTAMYEVLDPTVDRKKIDSLDVFDKGMALMLECDFNGASVCFDRVLHLVPTDKVSTLRRNQCDEYKTSDEIWDGIIQVNEK